jgi:hypothetical protein
MLNYWNDNECGTSDGGAAPAHPEEDLSLQTLAADCNGKMALGLWHASIMQSQAFAADRNGTTTLEFRNASSVQLLDFAADYNGIMALNSWNALIVQSQTRSAANIASAFRGVTSGRLEMPYSVQWNQGSIIVFLCGLCTKAGYRINSYDSFIQCCMKTMLTMIVYGICIEN